MFYDATGKDLKLSIIRSEKNHSLDFWPGAKLLNICLQDQKCMCFDTRSRELIVIIIFNDQNFLANYLI